MREREVTIAKLWSRMSEVPGVSFTARNPVAPPSIENLPAIQFFELGDGVVRMTRRGGYPVYVRELTVVVEPFIKASTEAASSKELGEFVQEVKKKIYEGGVTLGGTCSELEEVDCSRILRPPVGEHVTGIGIALKITYIENIAALFA